MLEAKIHRENKSRFSPRLRRVLRKRLRSGERVVWLGHPKRRLAPEQGQLEPVISVGFALAGAAMAIVAAAAYWFVSAEQGPMLPAQCRIILITGLGVFAVFVPFAADYLLSARTIYVLTSQRAIVWAPWGVGRLGFSSYALKELGPFYVSSSHRGNDVLLREREVAAGEAGIATVRTSFRDVGDADHIRKLAIRAQRRTEAE
jgi:hypothetical protein